MATGDTERSQRWHIRYAGGSGPRRWAAYRTFAECVGGAALCQRGVAWAPSFVELINQLVNPDLIRLPPTADW